MKKNVVPFILLLSLVIVNTTWGDESIADTIKKDSNLDMQQNLKKQKAIPSTIVDDAFHFSMLKRHKETFAIGYENYFRIKNFQTLKEQILDSLRSEEVNLVLFVNGNPFPEIKMSMCDETNKTISFFWSRDDAQTKAYSHFYTSQWIFSEDNLNVGFGLYYPKTKNWKQISTKENIQVTIITPYAIGLAILMFVLLILSFLWLILGTDLLYSKTKKDSHSSLSSTQMAFWTFIFFFSYIYLWIVNKSLAEIPDSTLALLGISTLTTAASKGVTLIKNKDNDGGKVGIHRLISEKKGMKAFYNDLTTEGDYSTSIHRVQMLLFTGLFGFYYLIKVFFEQALPDLTENMLWLIGISSGAFVGVKSVYDKNKTTKPNNSVEPLDDAEGKKTDAAGNNATENKIPQNP